MRKITRDSIAAFLNGERFSAGNMSTSQHTAAAGPVSSLYLHGNLIAEMVGIRSECTITISDGGGWETPTTASRLNGIFNTYDLPSLIGAVKGAWEINGEDWHGSVVLHIRDSVIERIESTRPNGDMILVPMAWAS